MHGTTLFPIGRQAAGDSENSRTESDGLLHRSESGTGINILT